MANKKISELTATTPKAALEFAVNDAGTTKKIDLSDFSDIPCSYLVFKDGSDFKAKNGATGEIDSTDTDAVTVIQYALDNLTAARDEKEKVVLKGNFTVNGTKITVPSYTILEIQGSITQNAGFTNGAIISNSDFVGGNTDIAICGGYLIGETARTNYQSGIYIENADIVHIDGVHISGMENHGIDIYDEVTNFVISSCVCDGNGDDGITIHGNSSSGIIFNNICINGTSATGSSSGIEVECQGATAPSNISIVNNTCHSNANGIHVIVDTGSGLAPIKNISVIGNQCHTNTSSGITASGDTGSANTVQDFTYIGNNCYNNTKYGFSIYNGQRGNISGNTISGNEDYGIYIHESEYITVNANSITDSDEHAIRCLSTATFIRITNNTLLDNGQTATGYGVRIEGDSKSIIQGNLIGNTGGAATPQYGIYCTGSAGDLDIHDNQFLDSRDITGKAIYLQTLSGNPIRISNNKATTSIDYVTENNGTGQVDSGSTSDVITHGLDFTPDASDINLTMTNDPTNSPGNVWIDTIGATTFTVNCENDPGASHLTFSWAVHGKKS